MLKGLRQCKLCCPSRALLTLELAAKVQRDTDFPADPQKQLLCDLPVNGGFYKQMKRK